ncbi:response regulator transcription factor [Nocardioides jensenii]|uniref:response regulator transcription factor n=1 Tax=Nocardioides jensenii TaxID=1843 RepID=UPI000AE40E6E|nr:response regulator transcription factor [Nocardioides jensenii]
MERTALVIEDDEDIRGLIEHTLSSQGLIVATAADGPSGVDRVRELDPDLVTLDLGLPGFDGIEACRRIREFSDAYIVMITAREDEIDRLIGLETGADDFLVKPFSPRELKARVNALFRRPRRTSPSGPTSPAPAEAHEVLHHGAVKVDVDARQVWVGDEERDLTRIEFDLLAELVRRPARVWSRETLLRTVWGNEWAGDTHLVEVHVGNLRRKLGETQGRRLIRTVRGVGYRMEPAG